VIYSLSQLDLSTSFSWTLWRLELV
jgi:hypothetical protein